MEQNFESLEEITNTIIKNKKSIDKKLKNDSKKSAKLERKLSKSRKN